MGGMDDLPGQDLNAAVEQGLNLVNSTLGLFTDFDNGGNFKPPIQSSKGRLKTKIVRPQHDDPASSEGIVSVQ